MGILFNVLFFLSTFIIFWAIIGYPLSLKILKLFYNDRGLIKDYSYKPTVTVMVVAHNEEKVIKDKLANIINLDYPSKKIKFIISSDNSSDNTNKIVEDFIDSNPQYSIKLYKVKERKGKTNAQNEAQKLATSEILVMTDANSILKANSIKELTSPFFNKEVAYVCGKLVYINSNENSTASSENTYWSTDLEMRKIESDIQTITAGNGALYACRNKEYYNFDPIKSHDANMPRHFALKGKKALFNQNAIAYEKAGEIVEDEFKRKVRMNRGILQGILPNLQLLNFFRYRWYTYFYLGHRTCRYLLWLAHGVLFFSSFILMFSNLIYILFFIAQIVFYIVALSKIIFKIDYKYINYIHYYTMTIVAQVFGVINILTGRAKPTWEKVESTR